MSSLMEVAGPSTLPDDVIGTHFVDAVAAGNVALLRSAWTVSSRPQQRAALASVLAGWPAAPDRAAHTADALYALGPPEGDILRDLDRMANASVQVRAVRLLTAEESGFSLDSPGDVAWVHARMASRPLAVRTEIVRQLSRRHATHPQTVRLLAMVLIEESDRRIRRAAGETTARSR